MGGVLCITPTCSTSTCSVGAKLQAGQWVRNGGTLTSPHLVHLHPKSFFSSLRPRRKGENLPFVLKQGLARAIYIGLNL